MVLGRWSLLAGMVFAGLFLAGCQTEQQTFAEFQGWGPATATVSSTGANGGATNGHTLPGPGTPFRVGDMVIVKFSGPGENIPLPHEERIKEDGTITLSLIGPVTAAGKTAGELQRELQAQYSRFYRNLTPNVQSQLQVYYVGGEVRAPGPKEYLGQTDIIKAVQSAGDFTDFANKKKVKLTRSNGRTEEINCIRIIEGKAENVLVMPGDRVHVPRRLW